MLALSLAKIHLLRILLLIHNQTWSFPFPRYLQSTVHDKYKYNFSFIKRCGSKRLILIIKGCSMRVSTSTPESQFRSSTPRLPSFYSTSLAGVSHGYSTLIGWLYKIIKIWLIIWNALLWLVNLIKYWVMIGQLGQIYKTPLNIAILK